MSFRTKRVFIATPFYMLFEFFLLKYFFLLFGGVKDVYLFIATLLLGGLQCIPMIFEEKKSTAAGRFCTEIFGIWQWAMLMILIDLIVIYAIKQFIGISLFAVCILLAVVPILGVYSYFHAHKLVVKEHTLKFDNLKEEVNIVHLSDIHFGAVRHKKIINHVADKLNELSDRCDIAIVSGDLADGSCVVKEDDFQAFKKVNMPIVFTPGNHDFYPGIENVCRAAKKAGMIILDDEKMEFKGLNIFGLSFTFGGKEDVSKEQLKQATDEDAVNIINYHVPYGWDLFTRLGYNLQLSGHTHGGQFYPMRWFCKLMFKYNMGIFEKNGSYLSVTTGVGSMDTPMRLGTDSELVILKLRKK
ncbi:MAG: metallophosphoesterase [Methanobrevibacter smithii]|jgi:predicted MPP superfamily phosphohydrolase